MCGTCGTDAIGHRNLLASVHAIKVAASAAVAMKQKSLLTKQRVRTVLICHSPGTPVSALYHTSSMAYSSSIVKAGMTLVT